jgi:hypothetical protein
MNEISEEVAKATNGGAFAGVEAELEAPVQKVKMKQVKETDAFVLSVQEISKLSAEAILAEVPKLLDAVDENYFHLGGFLSVVLAYKHYETAGFKNFNEFVESYGMRLRKAQYLIQIYDKLIESGVPWSKVKDVGWTKLRGLASILTLENADEWVERALSSTVLQLQEAIKKALAGTLPNSGITPDSEPSKVTTFNVKVHDEQKQTIEEAVAKARAEANTDYDGVALEAICMNYLSGGNVTKPVSLTAVLEKYSPEEVLKALETVFTDFVITAKLKHHVCG